MRLIAFITLVGAACGGTNQDSFADTDAATAYTEPLKSNPNFPDNPASTTDSSESLAIAEDDHTSLLADWIPFDWTIDFDSRLRGRDMKSSDGKFCLKYNSDGLTNPRATPYTKVTLVRNRSLASDVRYDTKYFDNDGVTHSKCWSRHDQDATYHFDYELPSFGYSVKAHGRAYH